MFGFISVTGMLNARFVNKFSKRDSQELKEASNVSVEAFKNIRTVCQLNKQSYFISCYKTVLFKPHWILIQLSRCSSNVGTSFISSVDHLSCSKTSNHF